TTRYSNRCMPPPCQERPQPASPRAGEPHPASGRVEERTRITFVLTLVGWRLSSAVGVGMGLDCIDYDGASDGCEACAAWEQGTCWSRGSLSSCADGPR